jgi:hypothetical protein
VRRAFVTLSAAFLAWAVLGAAPLRRYEIFETQVLDSRTHLWWERFVPAQTYTQDEAKSRCADLVLEGWGPFRLPTVKELQTIVDEQAQNPAIDRGAFPDTPSERFWSGTLYVSSAQTGESWLVGFAEGVATHEIRTTSYRVRCVR